MVKTMNRPHICGRSPLLSSCRIVDISAIKRDYKRKASPRGNFWVCVAVKWKNE